MRRNMMSIHASSWRSCRTKARISTATWHVRQTITAGFVFQSFNLIAGLTTTENTGMPQPDGNMQYARFASPEDFVDHYFKWWGSTIQGSGSDVQKFTSKLKAEGYFGADLGSYTQAVERHLNSLSKEGFSADAKPVQAQQADENAQQAGAGYIRQGEDAWNGFDGRYVGASSAFSQSNYDNMGKVQPETIAGVNALASEYFKRTGKKLLLNSLAGGSHPSNASEWGHAAGWKADIDNTGVDTRVFLDICEKLGIGAALEKDTHFDLSFGKGNAYMSTDQGTSDRTGSRWYAAYHSGKANTSTKSSQSETKSTPPIDINKLFAGIGENSAFGRTFFDAFTRDVGDSTTNENLLVTLEKMKNVRGQFMNTKKNREALAAAFELSRTEGICHAADAGGTGDDEDAADGRACTAPGGTHAPAGRGGAAYRRSPHAKERARGLAGRAAKGRGNGWRAFTHSRYGYAGGKHRTE